MYKNIEDFIAEWKEEAEGTLKIFGTVDNEALLKKPHADVRTLGRSAWHITQTLTEMPMAAGIRADDPLEGKEIPGSISAISGIYKKYSEELVDSLEKNWKGADLSEMIDMYGRKWSRSRTLSILLRHQIHHRAQMTVAMRLLGMKVPGFYGPAREEWAEYGMETQE